MYDFRVSEGNDIDSEALVAWLARGLDRKKGKTQSGLADALGVSQPRISEMLRRKRRIHLAEIPKIAEYVEEAPPLNWLNLPQEPPEPSSKSRNEIRFGLHEDPSLVWVFIFSDDKLLAQFEAGFDELTAFKRQLERALDSLPQPKLAKNV